MMSVRLINLNILLLLFAILIISSLKSSELSIVFFNNLRLILIVITFFLIIISLFKTSVNKKLLRQILLLLFIIVYGISLNFINIKNHDLFINIDSNILILYWFVLTFFLLKIVTYYYNDLDNYNHFIFIFFLISTFIFFLLDGYNFKELKYNFDLTSGYQITYNIEKKIYGIGALYSINLTRVFFLAVFTAFYLYKEINGHIKPAKNILYLLTSLFFLFFAISGGAKGEVIFGLLILFFMFVSFVKKNFIASAVFLSLAVLIINIFFESIVFFERLKLFLSGNYNYDYRLELITLSFNLLYNEPKCLLFGCGFLFFQDYYGFNAGAYPHNLILEFIITYGLLISIYIFTLIFIGLKNIFF